MKRVIILVLINFIGLTLLGQTTYTVSGKCLDSRTNQPVSLVTIYETHTNTVVATDSLGHYEIELADGSVYLEASFVGYSSGKSVFLLRQDTVINFYMNPTMLGEVKVVDKRVEDVVDAPQIGEISLSPKIVNVLPALGGEPDLIKVLQLLPGVNGGKEGSSDLYVRGGTPDQNLILIDGVPLYNVSHLGGFFSSFNTDAISSVTLKKGSFPARYGGRLSSVLDVKMKTGSKEQVNAKAAIGLLASKFTIDGPIKKGRSSYIFSARRTYPDLPIGLINKLTEKSGPNGRLDTWKLHFYDIFAKTNFSLSEKNELSILGFLGNDLFAEGYTIGLDKSTQSDLYKNKIKSNIASMKWTNQSSRHFSVATTLSYVKYASQDSYTNKTKDINASESSEIFDTQVADWILRSDVFWNGKSHGIRAGLGGIYHRYAPSEFAVSFSSGTSTSEILISNGRYTALEGFGYVEDDWIFGQFRTNIGLHFSHFQTNSKKYFYAEPRVAVRYLLNENWSLKASYSNMAQYVNLVSNDFGPNSIWTLTYGDFVPQIGNQFSVGTAMKNKKYELALDGYYKTMNHILESKGILDPNTPWENSVVDGEGESYGGELFIKKNVGKFSGWVGYGLSWNWRQFDYFNGGKRYPFRYDRRHDLKIVLNYQKSPKTSFSAIWVYATGDAVTLPISRGKMWSSYRAVYPNKWKYSVSENLAIFSKKNAFRAPAYHRLDLGIRLKKNKKRGTRTWAFGLYNVYARANPFYLFPKEVSRKGANGQDVFDRYAIFRKSFFSLLPSASYIFELN